MRKRILDAAALLLVLSIVVTLLMVGSLPAIAVTDWDKSSLEFTGACSGDCDEITAEICNTGDGDMEGTVNYEVWFATSGNPKSGSQVGGGTVPALASGDCATLTHTPSESGNYMFKAYQRDGHPGTGELWTEQCSVDCPPPVCAETGDPVYGPWSEWSEWSECVDGEQTHTRSREVVVYDLHRPEVVCDSWMETESDSQWCNLCQEVDTHTGDWSGWSEWSECSDGWKTRTRSREIWTTDVNHPEHECDRWPDEEIQTEACDYCVVTELKYGDWSEWSEWSDCVDEIKTRTRTRDVWEMDVLHEGHVCGHDVETQTDTESCIPGVCEVVDPHSLGYCTPWSECVDGTQWRECTQKTWTTDHYRPEIVCSEASSIGLEERKCEEPEDKTPAGQVELIFSCPVLEGYFIGNFDPVNNVPLGKSLFDIPGPCGPDECKVHPRGGYWRFAEPVPTMLANGRLDPYGEYWIYMVCWSEADGWWPVGLVRPMYYEVDVYPTFPIRWWVEAWADPNQTPGSFDHDWYQVIVPDEWYLLGLK